MISKKLPLFAILTTSVFCAPAFAMNWIYAETISSWDILRERQDEVIQELAYQKKQQEKFILLCSSATFDQKDVLKKMFASLATYQQKQVKNLYKLTLWTLYIKKCDHEQAVAYNKKLQEAFLELKYPHYKDKKKLKRALKILRSMDESHPSYADMAKLVQLLALKCQSYQPFKQKPKLTPDHVVINQDEQETDWNEIINKATTIVSWANKVRKPVVFAAKTALKLNRKRGK